MENGLNVELPDSVHMAGLTDDLTVDMDGGEGAIKTSFTTAQKDGSGNYINNAVYVKTGSNIKVLVVDAGDNDLSAANLY